ncbi:MAG: ATPase, T2SS/T4P/T4SS family [Smithellaceae bacterium]|jgi:type II secretory ATPase GspE/PulE/Tfp pilus assembly ATPase PilB-like protein|nr:Flp pilus assembly complex ATPase component TadA [Syntrophaceae bacterium]HPL98182.1 ATPase, T2SS/T4P/T4SS family [Smithellaceae bacterium]
MTDSSGLAELQNILRLEKGLQEVTGSINSAQNIKEILINSRPLIVDLFQVEAAHIYIVNNKNKKEIMTLLQVDGQIKERKTAVSNETIPGYVTNTGRLLNISDFSNNLQINQYSDLLLESNRDSRFGVNIRQILAMPIVYGGEIMGAVEIINRKQGDGPFSDEEPVLLQEISEVLGVAIYNQLRIDPKTKRTKFGYLLSNNLITEEDLNQAKKEALEKRESLEDVLMRDYKISKNDLGQSLEFFYQSNFVVFDHSTPIPGDLLKNLKKEYLMREKWVPLARHDKNIRVIVDDPQNILKRDTIESILKTKNIKYEFALKEDILKYIEFFYRENAQEATFTELIGRLDAGEEATDDEHEEAIRESDSAVIQLVNKIINDAFLRRASDIHIEPDVMDKNVLVRYRVDGDCALYQTLPYSYRAAIVSRIKVMSNLDITIKRVPQDGKIKIKKPGVGEIELRVATIPTQGGVEDVVMRILAKGDTLPLEAMSMTPRNYREILRICEQPYGMILCVGPTGSGKTTTLHAILRHINKPDRKIWTAEDPVEITQRGLRQVQVQPKIGFDFAAAMRSFLRADPDIIMVGEMRDFETAKIAVEASLTGHLVLSTLHTNSAPETISRLLDMGIDPLNFADSLLGVLAQRLVRVLCEKCKEAYNPTQEEFDRIVESYGPEYFKLQKISYSKNLRLYRPKGCEACDKTGYRGRIGIHELLLNSEEIKKRSIERRESIEVIRNIAMSEGMLTLYQDGILKAFQGVTDVKQIHRVCQTMR